MTKQKKERSKQREKAETNLKEYMNNKRKKEKKEYRKTWNIQKRRQR